jgi:hypothetical protein
MHLHRTLMTHRFDPLVTVHESRRAAYTTGRKIGSGVPVEGQGAARPRCGAVAGTSVHGPMT